MVLLYSLLFLTFATTASGSCSFPSDLLGTWRSSRWDDLIFTSTQVTVPELNDLGTDVVFECDTKSGTKYLIRSTTTVVILGNNVQVVACLDLKVSTSGVKYIYYHATDELSLPSSATHPVRLVTPNTAISTADTCTITSYATGTNDVMIKTNMIEDAVITCPNPLLANFDNYTVTNSGTTSCDGVGYIHVCDDSKTVLVDYGLCSTVLFYSDLGNLSCVYYSSSGSTFYVNLLNNEDSVDNSATYHYSCVVIDYTASPVYFSQWPRKCNSGQTATSVPSVVGSTFEAYTNVTCVPGSSGGFPIIIIIIIILLIIIGILTYYFCIKKKMWKKKIKPRLPCSKDKSRKKKGQVDPMNDVSGNSQAPLDGHRTGLQATAVVTPHDRLTPMNLTDRRNLETSQSTRSAITVSHMQTEFPEDPTPRRLPPLEAVDPNQPPRKSDDSDTPSLLHRLPPISESFTGLEPPNDTNISNGAAEN